MMVRYIVCSRTFQTTLISRNQNTAIYLAVIIFIRKYTLGDSIRKQICIYIHIFAEKVEHIQLQSEVEKSYICIPFVNLNKITLRILFHFSRNHVLS